MGQDGSKERQEAARKAHEDQFQYGPNTRRQVHQGVDVTYNASHQTAASRPNSATSRPIAATSTSSYQNSKPCPESTVKSQTSTSQRQQQTLPPVQVSMDPPPYSSIYQPPSFERSSSVSSNVLTANQRASLQPVSPVSKLPPPIPPRASVATSSVPTPLMSPPVEQASNYVRILEDLQRFSDSLSNLKTSKPSLESKNSSKASIDLDQELPKIKQTIKDSKNPQFLHFNKVLNINKPLSDVRAELVNSEYLSDLKFIVDGQQIYGHKTFLITASFLFYDTFHVKGEKEMTIEGVELEIFLKILSYCYTDKIQVTEDNVLELLLAGNKLQVRQVSNICNGFISKLMNPVTIFTIFDRALEADNELFQQKCIDFINKNEEKCFASKGFFQVSLSSLMKMLEVCKYPPGKISEIVEKYMSGSMGLVDEGKADEPELDDNANEKPPGAMKKPKQKKKNQQNLKQTPQGFKGSSQNLNQNPPKLNQNQKTFNQNPQKFINHPQNSHKNQQNSMKNPQTSNKNPQNSKNAKFPANHNPQHQPRPRIPDLMSMPIPGPYQFPQFNHPIMQPQQRPMFRHPPPQFQQPPPNQRFHLNQAMSQLVTVDDDDDQSSIISKDDESVLIYVVGGRQNVPTEVSRLDFVCKRSMLIHEIGFSEDLGKTSKEIRVKISVFEQNKWNDIHNRVINTVSKPNMKSSFIRFTRDPLKVFVGQKLYIKLNFSESYPRCNINPETLSANDLLQLNKDADVKKYFNCISSLKASEMPTA